MLPLPSTVNLANGFFQLATGALGEAIGASGDCRASCSDPTSAPKCNITHRARLIRGLCNRLNPERLERLKYNRRPILLRFIELPVQPKARQA